MEKSNCFIISYNYAVDGTTSLASFTFTSYKTGEKLAEAIVEQIEYNLKSRDIKADGYAINSIFNCGPNKNEED